MIWKVLTIIALVFSVGGLLAAIGGNAVQPFGGTTADDWNVGGNLSITGTSVLTGNTAVTGTLTITGETNVGNLVYGGATTTMATTSPYAAGIQMTAAQFCDNSLVFWANNEDTIGSSTDLYLPTAASLIADCLPAVGDTKTTFFQFANTDTASSTVTASTSINLLTTKEGSVDTILEAPLSADGYRARITCYNYNGTEVNCEYYDLDDAD